jgi:hypothetical protein
MKQNIRLEAYYEQGMSHTEWMGVDIGLSQSPNREDNLIALVEGDLLTIFEDETLNEVVWQGKIKKQVLDEQGKWTQANTDEKTWKKYFYEGRYAQLERAK